MKLIYSLVIFAYKVIVDGEELGRVREVKGEGWLYWFTQGSARSLAPTRDEAVKRILGGTVK